ncbi:MAG: hypothetical protein J5881_01095 [Clostridia bacterium]|nr:hypothetical protein [Clostridia bacterium]
MEKATEAREKDKQGTELEAIKLAVVNSVASGLDGFVDITSLKSGLNGLIQENPEDVIIGDGPWVVTSTLGKVYEINKNSIVNELTGLVLTPKSLTLTIEGDTYEEKTINARLIDIDGNLTWSDSTDIIDITPSADGMSATIKAKKAGTEAITVNCSNGDTAECAVKVENNKKPIGEYIQYNVGYVDMYSKYEFTSNDGDGWRIFSVGPKDKNGNYTQVKIISTGIPIKLSPSSEDEWLQDDETIDTYSRMAYGLENNFESIVLKKGSGNCFFSKITVGDLEQTEETTGAIFKTNQANSVKCMTKPELETAFSEWKESTGNNNTNIWDWDLFYLNSLTQYNYTSKSKPEYWLATKYTVGSQYLCYVTKNGSFYEDWSGTKGVRPVVTLKKSITYDENLNVWIINE